MEVSRHTIFCSILTLIAVVFLLVQAHDSAPKEPVTPPPAHATAATAQSIQIRDREKARLEGTPRQITTAPAPTIHIPPEVISPERMAELAWERATREVQLVLKTPSVAQFPLTGVRFAKTGAMTWIIQGYVDTQNSFGAMIRETYQVTVRYAGSPKNASVYDPGWWIPEALQVGTQKYGYEKPKKTKKSA